MITSSGKLTASFTSVKDLFQLKMQVKKLYHIGSQDQKVIENPNFSMKEKYQLVSCLYWTVFTYFGRMYQTKKFREVNSYFQDELYKFLQLAEETEDTPSVVLEDVMGFNHDQTRMLHDDLTNHLKANKIHPLNMIGLLQGVTFELHNTTYVSALGIDFAVNNCFKPQPGVEQPREPTSQRQYQIQQDIANLHHKIAERLRSLKRMIAEKQPMSKEYLIRYQFLEVTYTYDDRA